MYPRLARIGIDRIKRKTGGIEKLVDPQACVCALYGKIIGGLFPYVKMSKSIKESSINLGDSDEVLFQKIVKCGDRDDYVILQMMTLASNWDLNTINKAEKAYKFRKSNYNDWLKYKNDYYLFFKKIKKIWDDSETKSQFDTYDAIFKRGSTDEVDNM